jgi:hypothetical protein
MRILLAIWFFAHGVAHLAGFLVAWQLRAFPELPYHTTKVQHDRACLAVVRKRSKPKLLKKAGTYAHEAAPVVRAGAASETESLETKVGVAADEITNYKSGFNAVDDPHRMGSHRPYRLQHDRRQLREVDAAVGLSPRRVPSAWGV